jgi:SAM-dependent methyltransferase
MQFDNVYQDPKRADSYAKLEFPGTYYLAYRDLPEIIAKYAKGKSAIDFGCGAGRSTRFLQKLGFRVIGIDIAPDMIVKALEIDPAGDYRLMPDNSVSFLEHDHYNLVLSAFTFDNIPTLEKKVELFSELGELLDKDGVIVNLVSSPDIYINEWASFTTKDFPENRKAKTGDKVKIVMTDVEDSRPVEDIIWADDAYREVYQKAGLQLLDTLKPLAKDTEPFQWVNETKIAPWVIYVLGEEGRISAILPFCL